MQVGANRKRAIGIHGAVAFLYVLNNALLVDHDVGALRPLIGLFFDVVTLQNAVGGEHLVAHIAEQRKLDANLFGEGGVGGRTIHAYAENFRIGGVDLS